MMKSGKTTIHRHHPRSRNHRLLSTNEDASRPLCVRSFTRQLGITSVSARYRLCHSLRGMKPRILIVDDDSQITQQLYWTLCDEYDVVTANDMQTAIRRATFYKPDISILDLQMPPEKDSPTMGLRLVEYIKGHLSNSKVLIMTSNTEPEVRNACFNAGADGFFAKPFELEDMLASICRMAPVHRMELFAQIL